RKATRSIAQHRCGIGRRGARSRAIALRPRADRPAAAARRTANAPGRAGQRQRQQHAIAARQRATVQGAWRWLAGFRAGRRPCSSRLCYFVPFMKLVQGTVVKSSLLTVVVAVTIAAGASGCSNKPAPEALRSVRTAEIRYDKTQETNRYVGTV